MMRDQPAMSDLLKSMVPTCPVCWEKYDSECHRPLVLQCSHAVCLACSVNLDLKFHKQQLKQAKRCPLCRKFVYHATFCRQFIETVANAEKVRKEVEHLLALARGTQNEDNCNGDKEALSESCEFGDSFLVGRTLNDSGHPQVNDSHEDAVKERNRPAKSSNLKAAISPANNNQSLAAKVLGRMGCIFRLSPAAFFSTENAAD